jgi:hypothetical protein
MQYRHHCRLWMDTGRYPEIGQCEFQIANDPEQANLIEKWRLRHANADAVHMWAISTTLEAGAFAFTAIVQDARILFRAERRQAVRMADNAEEYALSVVDSDVANSAAWQAAVLFVRKSIDVWRLSLKAYSSRRDAGSVSLVSATTRAYLLDPWETARRNFPHVDDETGRLTTRIVREFGAAILSHVQRPWDHLIVLGVLRYAARLLRGELPDCEPGCNRASSVNDILVVESYARANGLAPMLVPYSGPGKPARQALSLLRDARTLRDVMRAREDGEDRASIWQRAIDMHAFAVVALDPRLLSGLSLDEAYEVAAAAIRQAEIATRMPAPVAMPLLPPGRAYAPTVVALHAKACLPSNDPALVTRNVLAER